MTDPRKKRAVFVIAAFVIAFGYGFALFSFGPYPALKEAQPGVSLPEERFGYSGAELEQFLSRLVIEQDGAEQTGLAAYEDFQLLDVPNAALLAIALASAILFLAAGFQKEALLKLLVIFPVGMLASDLTENFVLLTATRGFPKYYPGLFEFAGTATLLKMSFVAFSVLSVLSLLSARLIRRLRSRKNHAG